MNVLSRRRFIEGIAAAAGSVALGRHFAASASEQRPFEMLVIGDSHMSGQGLREEHKFYYLVKEWIRSDVVSRGRRVNLKVKAHSGSRLDLHPEELEKMRLAGDDVNKFHHQEANLSQPSIRSQIDHARLEYADTNSVDLVMLSGGITDVLVANTVNPFLAREKQKELIRKYCNEEMKRVLEYVTDSFANAVIIVVGYFPIISTSSDVNKISRYLFKATKFPHPLHFTLTNDLSKQLMKVLRKRMALRSRAWVSESNRAISEAVREINKRSGEERVIFVESPITEQTCFGTKNSLLWDTDDDNLPRDERYAERKTICPEVFSEIKYHHYGKMSVRMCEIAAIGHPNIEGAKAFAEAVKAKLSPILNGYRAMKIE
jgi:hypothetical protein